MAQQEVRIPVPTISKKHNHIVGFKCAGKPDKIMGRKNNLFFACIGGRVTCSRDGNIPSWMIDAYKKDYDQRKAASLATRGNSLALSNFLREERARRRARGESTIIPREQYLAYKSAIDSGRDPASLTSRELAPASVVRSRARPKAQETPVEPDLVRQVTVGSSTAEVIALLGQPKWRLAAGSESWTYSLTTGRSAKLRFTGGKVSSVAVP